MNNLATKTIRDEFATDHHGLVFSFLRSRGLDESEYYDVVVFGYLKAVDEYLSNPVLRQKYEFSTIAYKAMRSALSHEFEKQCSQKRKGYTVSLETIIYSSESLPLGECLAVPDSAMMDFETELLLHELATRLSEREMDVVRMKMHGYGTREIAREHKTSMKGVVDLLAGLHDAVMSVCCGH